MRIVYWNLRSSVARGRVPTRSAEKGVVMLSGLSQGLLKSFLQQKLLGQKRLLPGFSAGSIMKWGIKLEGHSQSNKLVVSKMFCVLPLRVMKNYLTKKFSGRHSATLEVRRRPFRWMIIPCEAEKYDDISQPKTVIFKNLSDISSNTIIGTESGYDL